jgi:hypothetical protein
MIITKGAKIKCKKCFAQYDISTQDFGVAQPLSDERSMGYETQYTWTFESICNKCQNGMQVILEGYEYPEGVFNYEEFTANGCILIENPKIEIQHIEEGYEDN